jgi:hypothetical protein
MAVRRGWDRGRVWERERVGRSRMWMVEVVEIRDWGWDGWGRM